MQALSDAKAGENYTIKWMFGLPEAVDFLRQHHQYDHQPRQTGHGGLLLPAGTDQQLV